MRKRDKNWLSVRRVLRCAKPQDVSALTQLVTNERGASQDWVRENFLIYTKDLTDIGYDLDPGVYIRTITGVARGTARLKDVPAQFWQEEVQQVWDQVKGAISQTIKLLADRGVLCAQLLPSRNSLIPLFTFWARFGQSVAFDRAFHWFLLANADGRYSGSSVTTLSQDLATIRDAHDATSALDALTKELRIDVTFDATRFIEDYSRDRFGRLLLYLLLFDRDAIDWVSKVRIGYQKDISTLNDGFLPEWHHIFPRAALQKAKVPEDDWNVLANITVLNEATNRNQLRSKTPEEYVEKFHITADELEQHLVPSTAALTVDRYISFVTQRAEMLAGAANTYLKRLRELKSPE